MALSLQSFTDFAGTYRYVFLGCGTVIGATTLFTLQYSSKYYWKKRSMCSYPNLRENKTVMARLLTPEMFSKVKDKRTSRGYHTGKLIKSGLHDKTANNRLKLSSGESLLETLTGLLAGDEECYDIFSELIDPVICEVHQIDHLNNLRPEVNLNWEDIKGGNFYEANVLSCRVSTSRNIQGYGMIPGCSPAELLNVGQVIVKTLKSVEEKFERCHLSLPWQQSKLSGVFGLDPDSFPPQLSRDWPKGRFVWFTEDRQCRIFVNFLDHIKFYINLPGGDIQNAFRKYCELLSSVEEGLKRNGKSFMWSSKYGFLTSSPNNIGTGLEVQVRVRLPRLIRDLRFHRIIDVLPVKAEHKDYSQTNDVICISNKHKLRFTEVEIVQQVINSVTLLLELDKRMQIGEDVRDLLP